MSTRRKNANGLGGGTKPNATGRYQVRITVNGVRLTRYANIQAEGEKIRDDMKRKAVLGRVAG